MQPYIFGAFTKSCLITVAAISILVGTSAQATEFADDFSEFSLDELMNVEVTSVSLTSQSVMESAAAIHVITSSDIRRRGVRSLPEALRQVPGMEVAAIGAGDYAITARGFNEAFSNKLLVLIDGRSVYTPLFSGVYWDVQTMPVELIDRIEVIRGPGGSIWGSNAFNGIINVITKSAASTEGMDARAGGGTMDNGYAFSALGGALGDDTHYRLTAKWLSREGAERTDETRYHKRKTVYHAGLRFDHVLDARTKITIDGNVGASRNTYVTSIFATGPILFGAEPEMVESNSNKLNVSMRTQLTRALDNKGELMVQAYYDYAELSSQEDRSTYDLSLHHSFFASDNHHVTWGGNFRVADSNYSGSPGIDFGPDRTDVYASLFLQDQIELKPDMLKLVAGVKLEHTPFKDLELQPSLRLAYTPNRETTLWGAVSRAVRVPSHAENQATILFEIVPAGAPGINPGSLPLLFVGEGTNDFESEELVTFEAGLRHQMTDEVFLDATAFFSKHDNLRVTTLGTARLDLFDGMPVVVQPLHAGNAGAAESWGVEASLTWAPTEASQFNFMFSYLDINTSVDGIEAPFIPLSDTESLSPDFQVGLEWRQSLGRSLNLNTRAKYVDSLTEGTATNRMELDIALSWKVNDRVTVELVGENLLYEERQQFRSELSNQFIEGRIPRSLFGSVQVSF